MKKFYMIYFLLVILLAPPLVAQNKLIVENRIWEYSYTEYFVFFGNYNNWYEQYMFDGTREVNGKTYNQWKLVKRTVVHSDEESELPGTPIDSVVALMREEAGRVYLLLDGQEIRTYNALTHTLSEPFVAQEGTESLLYDFNLSVNDTVEGQVKLLWWMGEPFYQRMTILTPSEVVSVTPFELNNEISRKYTLEAEFQKDYLMHMFSYSDSSDGEIIINIDGGDDFYSPEQCRVEYAEIIGNCGRGNMVSLTPHEPIYRASGCVNDKMCCLSSVFDTDGTYIYGKPSGVGTLELSVPENDSRIFDLHGRVVENPQPGSVYIQNGKKFVAK